MRNLLMILAASMVSMATTTFACDVVPQGNCFVEETNQYIPADRFFSLVSEKAASNGVVCTVGRVKGKQSGRIYNTKGQRLEKDMGCLSHREIKQVQQSYGLSGDCLKYTCAEY